jgi:peptidoglycan/xylan/chitin deacetylase (PgdA/CDA1 family)
LTPRIKDAQLHKHVLKGILPLVLHDRFIVRGARGGRGLVCISFDCENDEDMNRLPSILGALKEANITTSFALRGDIVNQRPDLTRRILSEGHEIMNHTFSHPPKFSLLEEQVMRREVESFQEFMTTKFRYTPEGFRAPHLMRRYDKRLFRILQQNGLYDSSYVGAGVSVIDGVIEIPLTSCPDHPSVCFDYWHHFQLPLIASSFEQFLKLWEHVLDGEQLVNIFLDPRLVSDSFLHEMLRRVRGRRRFCTLRDAAEAWDR